MKHLDDLKCHCNFNIGNAPTISISDGETICIKTKDCFANQITVEDYDFKKLDWDNINPVTGPIEVRGAVSGDVLKVEILEINVADKAVILTGADHFYNLPLEKNQIKVVDIVNDKVIFNGKELPIRPMIGVIGTATPDNTNSGTPGLHGGNMDCKELVKGSTIYLPVNVDGGMLAVGDLHALMADGESCLCGAECCGEVVLKVSVVKKYQGFLPLIENNEEFILIQSSETLDIAVICVVERAVNFLVKEFNYQENDAMALISLIGDVNICQFVNPLKTVRLTLKKAYL